MPKHAHKAAAMMELLEEIAELAAGAGTRPTQTALPGVLIIQGEVPEHQLAAVYEPMVGLVVQGGKTIAIGSRSFHMKPSSYFVIPTEMPATGRVHQGPRGRPYLSVGLAVRPDSLVDLLGDLPEDFQDAKTSETFEACASTPEFLEAWVRMLRLLNTPEHVAALAPAYEREILYRTLIGPQGWRLRRLSRSRGKAPGIAPAIQWIRGNPEKSLDIARIAEKSGLGVTTFHRQFRQITGQSPVQFQKQLRLLEARKLLVYGGIAVSEAAFKVGYESPSQFNREYARLFGEPPARDAANVRRLESERILVEA